MEEIVRVIRHHVLDEDGLLFKLRAGKGFDQSDFEQLVGALKALADEWRGQSHIPKSVAALVYWLDRDIESGGGGYPESERQYIFERAMEVTELLIEIFEE